MAWLWTRRLFVVLATLCCGPLFSRAFRGPTATTAQSQSSSEHKEQTPHKSHRFGLRGSDTGPYTMPWTNVEESSARMKLWYRSHQQCTWFDLKPNMFIQDGRKEPTYLKLARPGPYLTILVTTSNKDLSGQHFRLSHFLKNMAHYASKHQLLDKVELIMVDYSSDPELPPLWEAPSMTFPPKDQLPLIRVITVSHARHKLITNKIKGFSDPHYWEYPAKNVAIRRACGEFVMITNPDVWLSEGFWLMVKERAFKPEVYYRTGRVDTRPNLSPESLTWSVEDLARRMAESAFRICGPLHTATAGTEYWFDQLPNLPSIIKDWMARKLEVGKVNDRGAIVMLGCPGDFTLTHRDVMMAVRGYPEVPLPTNLDDMILVHAVNLGLRCGVLPAPATMFHAEHPRGHQGHKESWQHVNEKFEASLGASRDHLAASAGASGKASLYNDNSWGLGRHDLPEHYI